MEYEGTMMEYEKNEGYANPNFWKFVKRKSSFQNSPARG